MWAQYDFIFALGMIFAFMDAYGIGANDVANSFATSVSSHSLTLFQACIAASIMEFLGGVLAGSRVSDTIRSKIIQVDLFANDPAVLMLAMWCALVGSSFWVLLASNRGWPVSTTHSITGAIIGVGIAITGDGSSVDWGWEGVGSIFAAWGIAPGVAGIFGVIIYGFIRYCVLQRADPTRAAIWTGPIWFFLVAGILTMTIVWKGAPNLGLNDLSTGSIIAATFGTAAVVCVLSILFWVPFVYSRVIRGDYTIKYYHFFLGPLLWNRSPPPDASEYTSARAVPDYYRGHHDSDQIVTAAGLENSNRKPAEVERGQSEENDAQGSEENGEASKCFKGEEEDKTKEERTRFHSALASLETQKPQFDSETWFYPKNLLIMLQYYTIGKLIRNTTRDVVSLQNVSDNDREKERLKQMHQHAKQYPNQAEHAYSFLQVMTACTMSFAHGSNDLANAVGPLSTIYLIWNSGTFQGSKAPVPVWILVYGSIALVIGLATYGYKIMAVLGNKITLHSPSRGFSMELAAACTTIIATRLALPVSTTQTITGATIAVGIMSSGIKGVSWRRLASIYFGWIMTLPVTGLISGIMFAIITNSPRFGYQSTYTG